jgi:uncharacterized protein YeaO (DUF488 family)
VADIDIARVYDRPLRPSGARVFLVDRVWPRGVRKADLDVDGWLKDAAPSAGLRKWFGHDPDKFEEFRRRYRAELDDDPAAAAPIVDAARDGKVLLMYGAKDTEHNQAVALREWVQDRFRR